MTEPTSARMQRKVGADFKVQLPMFSGRNDDWPVWSARFGAYAELAGLSGVLEVAEAQTAPISMVGASLEAIRLGKTIYAVLLTKTQGKAFSIVHLTARGAGAEPWRLLRAEYAGSSGARLGNMVREVVCPRDQWLADVSAGKDFLTSLIEWEIKVAAYEVASGDRISEAVRVATIMDHASDAVKSMLRLSLLGQRRSVDALKLWIRESSFATPGLFHGSSPVQVGAVSDGKKGKSKSTGDKGKGKGKGKDNNNHRSNDGDKAKGRDYWNSVQQQAQLQGYCSHCSNWCHKRADCRTRLAQGTNGAVACVQEPESEVDGVQAAQWSDADSDGADLDSPSWCLAALNNPRGLAGTLLVDSGADDHIRHPDFAKEFPMKKE